MSVDKKINSITVRRVIDDSPDLSGFEESDHPEDKKRLKTYGEDWIMTGIYAEAEIVTKETSYAPITWLINTIRGGGLWGIESDASKEDIKEIYEEQLENLKQCLEVLGFSKSEIAKAHVTYKDDLE